MSAAEREGRNQLDMHALDNSEDPAPQTQEPDASPQRNYHSQFNVLNGDITLASKEGTLYCLPSSLLQTVSGFFRTMLSLPQGSEKGSLSPEIISTYESDTALEPFLRIASCIGFPPWESYDQFEGVLSLASPDRYDAPGVLSVLQTGITAPLFLADPIRLYALATRFDWENEAKTAVKHTFRLHLYDPTYAKTLQRLSSKDLLNLLTLHHHRSTKFIHLMDGNLFDVGNKPEYTCYDCHRTSDNHAWRNFKTHLTRRVSMQPSEDVILDEIHGWPEMAELRAARCPSCNRGKYGWAPTMENIKLCFKALPSE